MSQLCLIMMSYQNLSILSYLIFSFLLGLSARTTCVQSSGREGLQGPPRHRDYNWTECLFLIGHYYIFFFSLAEPELPHSQRLVRHSTKIIFISSSWLIKVYTVWHGIAYYNIECTQTHIIHVHCLCVCSMT